MTRDDAFRGMLARLGADTYARLEPVPYIRTGYPHPIAYTYTAAYHCPECAAVAFGTDADGFIPETARDSEGNPIGAVAPWDEWHEPSETGPQSLSCDTCGRMIEDREGVDDVDGNA